MKKATFWGGQIGRENIVETAGRCSIRSAFRASSARAITDGLGRRASARRRREPSGLVVAVCAC